MNDDPNNKNQDVSQGNSQQPSIQKSYNSANISPLTSLKNKMYLGAKKAGNAFKSAMNVIRKGAMIAAKVIVMNPIFWIVLGILFFLILVLSVINQWRSLLNLDNVKESSTEIINNWSSGNITEEQEAAKEAYEKSGSLLNFPISSISEMKDKLQEKKDSLHSSEVSENNMYEELLEIKGTNDVGSSRIVSPDDKVSLYEHMLLISKYDFNNVKWKRYGHGIDGADSPMKEDLEQGVKYPSDQTETKFETFASLLRPYLISYEIPFSFFSGSLSEPSSDVDRSTNLPYAIVKNALSDITVNRYDVQKYTLNTFYRDYDYTNYYSSFNVTFTPNSSGGFNITYSNLKQNQTGSGHTNTAQDENGNLDPMREEVIQEGTGVSYSNKYFIAEADIFDIKLNNTYNYIPYSENDVNSRTNSDSITSDEELYSEVVNEENKIVNINKPVQSCSSEAEINQILALIGNANNATYNSNNNLELNRNYTFTFNSGTYEEREGTTFYVTRTWEDTLTQDEREEEYYSISDLIQYNIDISNGSITEEDFNEDEKAVEYYNKLEENEKLNRIDFLNSNPDIYKTYLKDANYTEYIGMHRDALETFCYYDLTEAWQDLVDEYKTFPYAYGKTYGFQNSLGSGQTFLSGISLLRQYIHTFEGDGSYSGGGRYDENYNKVSDDEKTVYYKVYNAGDDVHTVGYGVNMEANQEAFAEVGIDVNTVQYGDYIEKEIVDKIEENIIQGRIDRIKGATTGIELEEYQLHALVSHSYVAGNINYFVDAYNNYWKQETDDKYEELYEEYKDTPEKTTEIMSKIDFNNGIYDAFFSFYNNRALNDRYPGYITRQRSEYTLFQGGYYSTLKRFWGNSDGIPNGIVLTNGDAIDKAACLELQIWYEQNLFSGKVQADTNVDSGSPVRTTDISNTDSRGVLNSSYSNIFRTSYIFQCPWWSYSRGALYYNLLGREDLASKLKNASRTGDGRNAADVAAGVLGLNKNESIDGIKPYSIISFDQSGSECGHTAFVEAVTSDSIIVSDCGSGVEWYGVHVVSKQTLLNSSSSYYFVSSVCLADAL